MLDALTKRRTNTTPLTSVVVSPPHLTPHSLPHTPSQPPHNLKMPKFFLFVRATAEAERGTPPDRAMLAEMTAFNSALAAAVTLHHAEGLLSTKQAGARVRFSASGETS